MMRNALCLLTLILLPMLAHAAHRPALAWMQGYTSASGIECCGAPDCLAVPVALVPEPAPTGQVRIEVQGVILDLPQASVHASPVTQTYWCFASVQASRAHDGRALFDAPAEGPTVQNTRCVFYGIGW